MDYFNIVDPVQLLSAPVWWAVLELALVLLGAILLGTGLRCLPSVLAERHCKPRAAPLPPVKPAAVPAPKDTKPAPPPQVVHKPVAEPEAPAAKKEQAVSAHSPEVEKTLDDALGKFFEEEALLNDALLDAVPAAATAPPHPVRTSPPPLVKATEDSEKALAQRMMRSLAGNTKPQRPVEKAVKATAPRASETRPTRTVNDVDATLEAALEHFLEDEAILDDAILDAALEDAHRVSS